VTTRSGKVAVARPAAVPHNKTTQPSSALSGLQRAASEPAQSLSAPLRSSLSQRLNYDFSKIRIHNGPASADAAEQLGARAYTLGNHIHLGAEASRLSAQEFDRLMTHEAVHTVQQGGRTIAPHDGIPMSNPADTSEREAQRIADSLTPHENIAPPSRSLSMRDHMRASLPVLHVAQSVQPHIQRDLTGTKTVRDGHFDLNLLDQSNPGGKSGMSGTIKFTASNTAPDSDSIRLLQTVRVEDLNAGTDLTWTGGEANRNKVMTTADAAKGIDAGRFVDAQYSSISPRTKKADPRVSRYYNDYWNSGPTLTKEGSKKGATVAETSLWDFPGSTGKMRFSFETAAKSTSGTNAGYTYAALLWGFTLSDPPTGKIDNEYSSATRGSSATFNAAVNTFNKFFNNPGTATAPKT
jgi:Domain of unknown function (DUF4157)